MKTSRLVLSLGLLSVMSAAAAQNSDYGPEDEGRRFSDGSKVECRNVEVQKNTRDAAVADAEDRDSRPRGFAPTVPPLPTRNED